MKRILIVLLVVVLLLSVSSCGTVDRYNNLIAAYQKAQMAAANGSTTVVMGFNKIQNYMDLYDQYLTADVEKTKVYREALAGFGSQLKNQNAQYTDATGNTLDSSKIDLSKLVNTGSTPADMAITVNNYVVTFNEAPLAAVDAESLKETMRYVNEAYNEINAGISDWNKAAQSYNAARQNIPNDWVAKAAKALGMEDLPKSLPFYSMTLDENPSLPKVKD